MTQLHQDRRGVGLLGSKVEHRHDVALIVTAHRESDPGGQRAHPAVEDLLQGKMSALAFPKPQSSAWDPHCVNAVWLAYIHNLTEGK